MDLTVRLEVETMSDELFTEMRANRKAILVASSPKTLGEKAILRQKNNVNEIKDNVEKTLRNLSKYTPDATVGDDKFTEANKTSRLKELRQVLITLKRQDDYLIVAEKHSYEIAEKMIEVEGGGQLDPTRQKIVADLIKEQGKYQSSKRGAFPYNFNNSRQQPYGFKPRYQHPGSSQYYGYGYQPAQQVGQQVGQQSFPPPFPPHPMPQQFAVTMGETGVASSFRMPLVPAPASIRGRGTGSYRGGRGGRGMIDKSRDTCFDCQLVGHWQGDPMCPAGVMDPMPPGTMG